MVQLGTTSSHPAPSPSFHGRERTLQSAIQTLRGADAPRVLVIHGPPGIGKTSLLRRLHDALRQEQEVCQLDLTGVEQEGELVMALGQRLALAVEAHQQEEEAARRARLLDALRGRADEVLFLDNVEQLHEPLSALLRELQGAPHMRLVLGSRRVFEGTRGVELGPLASEAAIEVLLDGAPGDRRAQLEAQRPALEALAAELEHIPLALTLCAPRLGLFQPSEIVARLQEPERAASLRNGVFRTLEWSWRLLSDEERHLLSACAACAASFDAELAARCAARTVEEARAGLEALSDHSLLMTLTGEEGAAPRYRMLLSIKHFLLDRDDLAAAIAAARAHHAAAMVEQASVLRDVSLGNPWRLTPQQLEQWGPELELAWEWWRAAHPELEERELVTQRVMLWCGVHVFSLRRHDYQRARAGLRALIEEVEQAFGADYERELPRQAALALALTHADQLALRGDLQGALTLLHPWLERVSSEREELELLVHLGEMEPQGPPSEATLPHLLRGLELAERFEDDQSHVALLLAHGLFLLKQRSRAEALERMEYAAQRGALLANRRQLGRVLAFMGYTVYEQGDHESAHAYLIEALSCFEAHDDVISAAQTLRIMAWQSMDARKSERGLREVNRLMALAERHEISWLKGFGFFLRAQLAVECGQLEGAMVDYERARYHLERNGQRVMLAATLLYRSMGAQLMNDFEGARKNFEQGYALFEHISSPMARLHYLCELASWQAYDDDEEAALATLERARALLLDDNGRDLHRCMLDQYTCRIELMKYLKLRAKERLRRKEELELEALYRDILTRLSQLNEPLDAGKQTPLESSIELRLGWMLLERLLPPTLARRFAIELLDPHAEALIFDPIHREYRPPGQYEWVDLSKKENPFQLLSALVERHLHTPGEPIEASQLIARVWPAEKMLEEAAHNRLYVTLSNLRQIGALKQEIRFEEGGYMLHPELHVLEV